VLRRPIETTPFIRRYPEAGAGNFTPGGGLRGRPDRNLLEVRETRKHRFGVSDRRSVNGFDRPDL
jgi:hypothetical protein